ncbi:uncharacterized protein LOC122295145 [Carya illinoinensis]|uniref:uncharacterized protein LOC122295145 n=1 Tax=Carya illinoinensis TaxID=32201 RepID=UPI001C725EC9|nr:uncharacterized protein LOC122295145 [Carya illinoinensis]
MTSVNVARTWYKDEPFVLACQAEQCFYVKDRRVKGSWYVIQKFMNRNVYDIPQVHLNEDHETSSSDGEAYQDEEFESSRGNVDFADVGVASPLHRPDVQPFEFDASRLVGSSGQPQVGDDFIDDAEAESGSDSGVADHSSPVEGMDSDDDFLSDSE